MHSNNKLCLREGTALLSVSELPYLAQGLVGQTGPLKDTLGLVTRKQAIL